MKMEKSFQKDFFHLFLFLSKNKRKNYTFLSKIYNYLNLKKKKFASEMLTTTNLFQ